MKGQSIAHSCGTYFRIYCLGLLLAILLGFACQIHHTRPPFWVISITTYALCITTTTTAISTGCIATTIMAAYCHLLPCAAAVTTTQTKASPHQCEIIFMLMCRLDRDSDWKSSTQSLNEKPPLDTDPMQSHPSTHEFRGLTRSVPLVYDGSSEPFAVHPLAEYM